MPTETTSPNLRNTGIRVLGALPWGSHLCHFYQTKEDLLDILTPYFKAGLENNEFCLWVVTEPLSGAEATAALRKAVPDLDQRLAERQMEITVVPHTSSAEETANSSQRAVPDIEKRLAAGAVEIIPHDQWYPSDGVFDPARVIDEWKEKLDQALARGYSGMRVQGNEAWLKKEDWENFLDYEKRLNEALPGLRMIVLCTYPLAGRWGGEIFDAAHAHEFAIAKRRGCWEVLETPELKQTKAELAEFTEGLEKRVQERTRQLLISNEELRESESQLRLVIDTIPTMAWIVLPDGSLDFLNQRWLEYSGLTLEEALKDPTGTAHPEDLPMVMERWVKDMADGTPCEYEMRLRRADGAYRWFLVRTVPIFDEQGKILKWHGISTDIEDRKRAEEKLQQSEARFREVTESIDEVFWLKDAASNEIIYVSPAYEKVWGRSRESLYQAHRSWLDAVGPDDFERVKKAVGRQQETNYDLEYRIVRPDGSLRWIHDRAFLIRDSKGEIYRIAGVANDITANRELEQQLRQSQKMEAVGQLAGGIAHDFNNMLAVIQMHSSLLLDMDEMSLSVKSSLQDIMAAAERAGGLTRQLLTFSRREVKQARNLDLDDVIDTMIKLLRRVLGEDIAIETRFASSLPVVHADPGMVEQIIMNLAVNARDAMPNGGRLSVSLEPVEIGDARTAGRPGVTPGQFVCLSVSDTGSGIPPENLSRIFEPFFTTKEVGKGTGLGLATVFGIVEQHRGWIEVESEVNSGATFRVFLPATESGAPSHAAEPVQPKPCGGNEVILLVEDEPTLRVIARIVLEQHGYRVFPAPAPAAALEIWEKKRGSIDLLLTDLIMPGGMSGRELAERLLADEPSLKVIYTSGYSEDIVSQHLHLDPGRAFLQKPCSSTALLAAVRHCLDETSP